MIVFILISILAIAALIALALVIRDIGEELRGLDEDERRNADTIREIQKWRNGK